MIHFTLSRRVELARPDCQDRTYYGWRDGMSEEECYQVNRHGWVLGRRADSERHALFSAWDSERTLKLVRLAVEIDHIEPKDRDGYRSVVGRVLSAGHPVHDEYVGKPAPVTGMRVPVRYFASPFD